MASIRQGQQGSWSSSSRPRKMRSDISRKERSSISSPAPRVQPSDGGVRHQCLLSITKLGEKDTQQVGVEELAAMIEDLSEETLGTYVNCLCSGDSDPDENRFARRECIVLLGILAEVHQEALFPHVSRVVASVVRRLRTNDSHIREAAAEMFGRLAAHVVPTIDKSDTSLSVLLRPLFQLLPEQITHVQRGSAVTIGAVLKYCNVDHVEANLRHVVPKILKFLNRSNCLCRGELLYAIRTLIIVASEAMISYVPNVLGAALDALTVSEWSVRLSAVALLATVADVLGGSVASEAEHVVDALEDIRFDKVRKVREVVQECIQIYRELLVSVGKKYSKTRVGRGVVSAETPRTHIPRPMPIPSSRRGANPPVTVMSSARLDSQVSRLSALPEPQNAVTQGSAVLLDNADHNVAEEGVQMAQLEMDDLQGDRSSGAAVLSESQSNLSRKPPAGQDGSENESGSRDAFSKGSVVQPLKGTNDSSTLHTHKQPGLAKQSPSRAVGKVPPVSHREEALQNATTRSSLERRIEHLAEQQTHMLEMLGEFTAATNRGLGALESRLATVEREQQELMESRDYGMSAAVESEKKNAAHAGESKAESMVQRESSESGIELRSGTGHSSMRESRLSQMQDRDVLRSHDGTSVGRESEIDAHEEPPSAVAARLSAKLDTLGVVRSPWAESIIGRSLHGPPTDMSQIGWQGYYSEDHGRASLQEPLIQRYVAALQETAGALMALMCHTGPCFDRLDIDTTIALLHRMTELMTESASYAEQIFPWISQAIRLGLSFPPYIQDRLAEELCEYAASPNRVGIRAARLYAQLMRRGMMRS